MLDVRLVLANCLFSAYLFTDDSFTDFIWLSAVHRQFNEMSSSLVLIFRRFVAVSSDAILVVSTADLTHKVLIGDA